MKSRPFFHSTERLDIAWSFEWSSFFSSYSRLHFSSRITYWKRGERRDGQDQNKKNTTNKKKKKKKKKERKKE